MTENEAFECVLLMAREAAKRQPEDRRKIVEDACNIVEDYFVNAEQD